MVGSGRGEFKVMNGDRKMSRSSISVGKIVKACGKTEYSPLPETNLQSIPRKQIGV